MQAHEGRLGAAHSYAKIDPDNLVLTAMKKTEDGNALLLRFYEWAGQSGNAEVTVPEGAQSARLTNLMEAPYGDDLPVKDGRIMVPFHPFEIVCVQVNYPSSSR